MGSQIWPNMELQQCVGHRFKISDFLQIRSQKIIFHGVDLSYIIYISSKRRFKVSLKDTKTGKIFSIFEKFFQKLGEGAAGPTCALRQYYTF